MKRTRTAVLLLALVCAAAMTGCAEKRIPWKDAYDAAALTWDAAIYDSENGRISFVYESGADEIEAVEDTDRVSIYCGERCTVVIDYYEGVQELDEMEAELRGTYRDTMGSTLSEKTEDGEIAGYRCRHIAISGDIGEGGVYFCNTETGYLSVYYMAAAGCSAEEKQHMEDIIDSVRVGQFLETEEA